MGYQGLPHKMSQFYQVLLFLLQNVGVNQVTKYITNIYKYQILLQ